MSVQRDSSGRRFVQIEVEVPGTPEEVWQAIATGPGISSWFVPSEFEQRDGAPAALKMNMGMGMESTSAITLWQPPHKWAAQSDGWVPGMPQMASEWSVESRAGGKCIVRIVQSLFASTDDWDNQLESAEHGWPGFLRTLLLYLKHFRGMNSATMKWMAPTSCSEAEAWDTLTTGLGVKGLSVGQGCSAPAGVPTFGGVVEYITQDPYDALLRIDKPGPGIVALGTFNCGQNMVAMNFYLYGDRAAETVARELPLWDAWFRERFPMPTSSSDGASS